MAGGAFDAEVTTDQVFYQTGQPVTLAHRFEDSFANRLSRVQMQGSEPIHPRLVIEDGNGNVVLDRQDSSVWNGATFDPPYPDVYSATLVLDTGPHQGLIGDSTTFTYGVPVPECNGFPATILGTPNAETIYGTAEDDVIVAFGGDDTVRGLGGNDVVCAGPGKDLVIGGPGHDWLYGEGGRDKLLGGGGRDRLFGGPGPDILKGQGGKDRLLGQGGNDKLLGNKGADKLLGGRGDDEMACGPGNDTANGGPGTDTAVGCEAVTGVP